MTPLQVQVILHVLHISSALKVERLRLVNGSLSNQGRVEIYHDGQWGTICDDNFYKDEARAVCSSLGYRDGIALTGAHFGRGTGPIFVDDLHCSLADKGTNQLVLGKTLCYFKGWNNSNCYHGEDAGVECRACEEGWFGYSCIRRCHCSEPGCNSITGECYRGQCLPGWLATSCSQVCRPYTFGQSCSSECHCRVPGCDHVTGVCTNRTAGCMAGWMGIRCDQVCIDGKFGFSCKNSCHCLVPGSNIITGICNHGDCLPGWKGASCAQECDMGTFGLSCSSKCHCKQPGCDPVTGICNLQRDGCLSGWMGPRCDQDIFDTENTTKHYLNGGTATKETGNNNVAFKVAVSFLTVLLVMFILLTMGLVIKLKTKMNNSYSTTDNISCNRDRDMRTVTSRTTMNAVERDRTRRTMSFTI
ncbi:scavenger receptor class F member 1-like [Argopecten irradians]|uniref:scavenger receptor class F member 1-like n=1 Tax=Argopecten irradians TaxID=31199 RepID=UPI003713C188